MCFRDLLLMLTLHVLNSITYEVISHSSLIFPHYPLAPLPTPLARIIRCPFLKGSCEMFADFSHFSIT